MNGKMKATKSFIRNLSQCIFEEYKKEIPKEELKSSFVEAIKNISAGQLQDDLNTNFDKNLRRLEKSLKNLCVRELPSVSRGVDDSLEELTKSELDGRTDVEEHGAKHVQKVLYNLMGQDVKKPNKEAMKTLDDKQRYLVYRTFIQKLLNKEKVSDKLMKTSIQQFDDVCKITENKKAGKPKFDWFPMCDLLLQLATGSKPLAYIRVLKVLFDAIQNDVNKCLASQKANRAESLYKVLKKFLTVCHLGIDQKTMKESETKKYCRYMSALLSFYVDLSCAFSSRIAQKKSFGKEMAGFVCYLLQLWPETLLEVALQLQGLEDDSNEHYSILLPLVTKCLETKPQGTDHVYYLKYVLLVRQIKDAYGEFEQIQEWNFATKTIPAQTGFLDWLGEECPEALEHVPVEDKKFRKTKITRFLLQEAEDDLITILLNSLGKADEGADDDEAAVTENVAMETENLFYLDTAGGSTVLELADTDTTEVPSTRQKSKKTEASSKEITKETKSKHKPIVLKTLKEVEQLVNSDVQGDGVSSPQTYTLDPQFVMDKVKDPEDRKFLESEIISITSVSSIAQEEELLVDTEESETTIRMEDSSQDNSTDKSGKWIQSSSSTPNREPKCNKIKKNAKKQEADNSDISEIGKTEDLADPVTSASEDDHRVKSVVRKVTPKKTKSPKTLRSLDKVVSKLSEKKCQENEAKTNFIEGRAASDTQGLSNGTKDKTKIESENVISIDSDDEIQTQDNVYEISCDTDNTKTTSLSDIHESSVEIVDIILEPAEHLKNKPDIEISQGKQMLGKKESPRKTIKSKSPRKELSSKSPVSVNSNQTDNNHVPENNLSCISDLTATTSLLENDSCVVATTDISSKGQNSSQDSEMDNTVKYIDEKHKGSSYSSDSDALSDKPRRLLKKSLSGEGKDVLDDTGERQIDIPADRQRRSSRKSSSGESKNKLNDKDEGRKDSGSDVLADRPRRLSKKSSSSEAKEESGGTAEKQNELDSDAPKNKPRRKSRKSSSGELKDGLTAEKQKDVESIKQSPGSPKKGSTRISEMHTEDESELDVFGKTPEKKSKMQLGAKNTSSIEEKFIVKAIKGRKTPKKSKGQDELHLTQEISGSVSLFPGEDASDSVVESEADVASGQRSKSTEEIIEIVDEIKEKIKTPLKGKSVSKGKELLNESMFTDESIESLQDEKNCSEKELQSTEKRRKLKSDSESDSNIKTSFKSTQPAAVNKNDDGNRKVSLNEENQGPVLSPRKKGTKKGSDKKTPSKNDIPGDSENQNNVVVIDLIEEEIDMEQQDSVEKIKKGTCTETSEIERAETDKDKNKSVDDNKNLKTLVPDCIDSTPSPTKESPKKLKRRRSHSKTGCKEGSKELTSPSGTNKSRSDTDANASGSVEISDANNKANISIETTPNKKDLDNATAVCDQICPDSENESEGKGDIEIVTDSESETEINVARNRTPKKHLVVTDSETESEIISNKNRTPKQKLDDKMKNPDLIANKTPKSAGKVDLNGQRKVIKMPNGQMEKVMTPKSDSKSTYQKDKNVTPKSASKKSINQDSETCSMVKTPQSDKRKSLSPTKIKSASKEKSPVSSHREDKRNSDPEGDLVPTSNKKTRTKSKILDSDGTKGSIISSSSIESDEEHNSLPDIGVHLKPNSTKSNTVDSKSPLVPSNTEGNSSPKRKLESTPQGGKRQSQRTKPSPDAPASVSDQDTTTKRRQTRNKAAVELVVDSCETDLDVDGPTRPKRLRSTIKAAPETSGAKPAAGKGRTMKSKPQSESDATDVSDFEPRRTRKSLGGHKMTAIKDKIPEVPDEEPDKILCTPPGKIVKQRKVSASTSKKAVKKLDELRGTRKRRLSGELSDQSTTGNYSTDSEVPFPKVKSVTKEKKLPKRLSTPAVETLKESAKDTSGRRYSLRKK